MNRDEHIRELVEFLRGYSICMCPASKQYWSKHVKEIEEALKIKAEAEGE